MQASHKKASNSRGRLIAATAALVLGFSFAFGALPLGQKAEAEELVDLTLLFHSAVQGKIAPCG